jgi:uncharacterized membrane protein YkoI
MIAMLATCTYAQDIHQSNVPAAILNAFKLNFVNAEDVDWELEKGAYYVRFEINHKDHKAWLDDKGKIIKHEQELWESEIPPFILATIRSKCKYFDLEDAELKEENGKIIYNISFSIDSKDHDFEINGDGKLIRYEQELNRNEIPVEILTAMKNQFPSIDIDDAERIEDPGSIVFFVNAEVSDKNHKFWYDDKANMLKHKQDLRNSEIPVSVIRAISSLYPGFEVRDADKIEEGRILIYEIELRKSDERIQVIFNQRGEVQ